MTQDQMRAIRDRAARGEATNEDCQALLAFVPEVAQLIPDSTKCVSCGQHYMQPCDPACPVGVAAVVQP